MPFDREQPGPFKPGDEFPGAGDFNRIVRGGRRQIGGPNVGEYGDRVIINQPRDKSWHLPNSQYLQKFVVLQVFDDYLLCKVVEMGAGASGWWMAPNYQPVTAEPSYKYVYVAKPDEIRRSFWDGKIIFVNGVLTAYSYFGEGQRRATTAAGVTVESLTQPYYPGIIVNATKGFAGIQDPNDRPIMWTDANTGGRNWLHIPEPDHCVITTVEDICFIKNGSGYVTSGMKLVVVRAGCSTISRQWQTIEDCGTDTDCLVCDCDTSLFPEGLGVFAQVILDEAGPVNTGFTWGKGVGPHGEDGWVLGGTIEENGAVLYCDCVYGWTFIGLARYLNTNGEIAYGPGPTATTIGSDVVFSEQEVLCFRCDPFCMWIRLATSNLTIKLWAYDGVHGFGNPVDCGGCPTDTDTGTDTDDCQCPPDPITITLPTVDCTVGGGGTIGGQTITLDYLGDCQWFGANGDGSMAAVLSGNGTQMTISFATGFDNATYVAITTSCGSGSFARTTTNVGCAWPPSFGF